LCSRLCKTCFCQRIGLGPGAGPGALTLLPKLGLELYNRLGTHQIHPAWTHVTTDRLSVEYKLQYDKAFGAGAEPPALGSQQADRAAIGYHNAVASSAKQKGRRNAQSAEQSGQQDAVALCAGQNGQPDDSPMGIPGQNGQQSQPSKTPLKSPLHHEEAWEDTDDEMNVSTGQIEHTGQIKENGQDEMDWVGQIVASAGPEPAVATRAPAESGHLAKGELSCTVL